MARINASYWHVRGKLTRAAPSPTGGIAAISVARWPFRAATPEKPAPKAGEIFALSKKYAGKSII
jgi:hypothetical protein